MPSATILMPRTPNWERAPNPRIEILSPTDALKRFWTRTPGRAWSASSMKIPEFAWTRSGPVASDAEKGSRARAVGEPVSETTIVSSATVSVASSCAYTPPATTSWMFAASGRAARQDPLADLVLAPRGAMRTQSIPGILGSIIPSTSNLRLRLG